MINKKEIVEFIHQRFHSTYFEDNGTLNELFMKGQCYWFARILHDRFPNLQIYYNPIEGHFVAADPKCKYYYDWKGVHLRDDNLVLWSEIKKIDPIWAARIKHDCID